MNDTTLFTDVRVFDGKTGQLLASFFAMPGYVGGIFVAEDDLLGTAAVCEAVHGRDGFASFRAGSGGVAGCGFFFGVHALRSQGNFRRRAEE